MEPGHYNFTAVGGDCLPIIVRLRDTPTTIIDLSGYSAKLSLTWKSGSLVLSSTDAPPTVTLGGVLGTVTATLTGAQTNALPFGALTDYELILTQPNGCELTPLVGHVVRQ